MNDSVERARWKRLKDGNVRLDDKVAVVTGGRSGIGFAISERFAQEGATVVVLDRVPRSESDSTRAAMYRCVDVAEAHQVNDAFEEVVALYGRVDILAHIAGVDDPKSKSDIAASLANRDPLNITSRLTDGQWRRMMSVNLDGSFHCLRAALRPMIERHAGSIVMMSSMAGVTGVAGIPHYSAAKAAVLGLTRSVAQEVAAYGIRVNAIAPGGIVTAMTSRTPEGMHLSIPMGRLGEASEVASVATFLASDDALYVTGETINVNGGATTV